MKSKLFILIIFILNFTQTLAIISIKGHYRIQEKFNGKTNQINTFHYTPTVTECFKQGVHYIIETQCIGQDSDETINTIITLLIDKKIILQRSTFTNFDDSKNIIYEFHHEKYGNCYIGLNIAHQK